MMLTHLLDKKTFKVDVDAAYSVAAEFIQGLPTPILQQDSARRVLVVRYPHKVMGMIFWRCWSNTIEIRFKRIDEGSVVVEFRSRPNLFALRPPKGVLDPRDLIERVSVQLQQQERSLQGS